MFYILHLEPQRVWNSLVCGVSRVHNLLFSIRVSGRPSARHWKVIPSSHRHVHCAVTCVINQVTAQTEPGARRLYVPPFSLSVCTNATCLLYLFQVLCRPFSWMRGRGRARRELLLVLASEARVVLVEFRCAGLWSRVPHSTRRAGTRPQAFWSQTALAGAAPAPGKHLGHVPSGCQCGRGCAESVPGSDSRTFLMLITTCWCL